MNRKQQLEEMTIRTQKAGNSEQFEHINDETHLHIAFGQLGIRVALIHNGETITRSNHETEDLEKVIKDYREIYK